MELRSHKAYERVDDDDSAAIDGVDLADRGSWSKSTNTPLKDPRGESDRADQDEPPYTSSSFETGHDQFYDSREQNRDLISKQFFRWLGTAFFALFIAVAFKIYAVKGVITPTQKVTFNVIITALSLGLGLNFFEAFKDLAKLLRWRFLADGYHSVREVDLILGIENLITVIKLGWESSRKPRLFLFCVIWILLNLSAQVSIALVNLTYSLDDGTDWNGTYTRPGMVNVSDLSCYNANGCPGKDHEDISQARAHAYGEEATDTGCGVYNTTADILHSKNDYNYYCRRTPKQQEFAYRFSEYNPENKQQTFPHFTNRIITASSGPCYKYYELNNTLAPNLGGLLSAWNYTFTNGTYNSSIRIPVDMEALNGTTYVYRGVNIPQNATEFSCGPRCMWMWAHRSVGVASKSVFFQCPITVSQVSNTTDTRQELSDGMARLAASAIGLQGRFVTVGDKKKKRIWTQYQFYPFGTAFEVHFKTTDEVGAGMAEFAIGSISTLAQRNPQLQMQGTVPHLGSRVSILWGYAIALLVGIAGVHLILFAIVVYASRVVIIRDESNLSTARLLRSLMDHLGSSGTLLDGKQLGQALSPRAASGLVYGPQHDNKSDGYRLGFGTAVAPRTTLPNRRHPDGRYL